MPLGSPLGQPTHYTNTYTPTLLYPVPRTLGRNAIPLIGAPPFHGVDIWNGSELSWLNPKGKPEIAMAEFHFPADTPYIVESKSLKLYLNSFSQTHFDSLKQVEQVIQQDLNRIVGGEIKISLFPAAQFPLKTQMDFPGTSLDSLDLEIDCYQPTPSFLQIEAESVEESVYSHLLKSNCLATGQPDWGSLWIHYKGKKIDHTGLLKYIISFRNHSGFAEHCVEQIFMDLLNYCSPTLLTVYARYTKRGGLDINPFRSNFEAAPENLRQPRQ